MRGYSTKAGRKVDPTVLLINRKQFNVHLKILSVYSTRYEAISTKAGRKVDQVMY